MLTGVVELQRRFAGSKRGGIDPVAQLDEVGPGDSARLRVGSEVDHVPNAGTRFAATGGRSFAVSSGMSAASIST